MKILIADTYYPDFLKSQPFDQDSTYKVELRKVLDRQFGTADFYSRNLKALGWDARDVIANHHALQRLWKYTTPDGIELPDLARPLAVQVEYFRPDVAFFQDTSLIEWLEPPAVTGARRPPIIAAQCSCPWPGNESIQHCDVVFTSFPHYVKRIEALGVKAVYLPLAFEPSVLEGQQPERDIDISFVGGVGRDSHWRSGTDTLEIIAEAFQGRFHWYGYGLDSLPASSALRACYRGEAWGREMYAIYRRSKIVINRHGEIAQGFANNLRMYEATGCGAMLLSDNHSDLFGPYDAAWYSSPQDAVSKIREFLGDGVSRKWIAANGQRRTLKEHIYAKRMRVVSDALTAMLEQRQVSA